MTLQNHTAKKSRRKSSRKSDSCTAKESSSEKSLHECKSAPLPSVESSKTSGTKWNEFFAYGHPRPQGSKRLVRLRNGRTAMIDASKGLKEWRNAVTREARKHCILQQDNDIYLRLLFLFSRPKSHFNKRGLKPNVPLRPRNVDIDKLARAVCDALTGVAYHDDRQVCVLLAERQYIDEKQYEGVYVELTSLAPCADVG